MAQGSFISLEGPDGSGKTSVLKRLVELIPHYDKRQIVVTREPGGGSISEQIRQVILNEDNQAMEPLTEAMLFAAGRHQHLADIILPAVRANQLVISDRFVDSSIVYQGVARGLGIDLVWQINRLAIEDHLPDITLLIDVPAEVGLERIYQSRGQRQYDRLDQESLSFHQEVRQAYLDLAEREERIQVIDGQGSVDQVAQTCLARLIEYSIINS